MTVIQLEKIVIDPAIQLRARHIDSVTVGAYVEAISSGAQFPPITIFDDGQRYWLADGFHRVSAYRFLNLPEAEAIVRPGTRQEALVFAATANVANGRPMSQAEKREAGERLIKLTGWNDSEIARRLAISHQTVMRWRQLSCPNGQDTPRTVTRNGSTYPMDTGNIGKQNGKTLEATTQTISFDTCPLFDDPELDAALDDESKPVCPECGQVYDGDTCPDCQPKNRTMKPKTNYAGNVYAPQGMDACQTPAYAVDPILPYLLEGWTIWEPACGEGLLEGALYDSGFYVASSDLLTGQNFFEYQPDSWDCLVTNPPFSIKYKWLERCYELGKPFALLLPVETLGAKTAQEQFIQYGVEVIFLNRRVNFKMPNKGFDGSAAQFPVAWFTWGLSIGKQMTFAKINEEE